jgi:GT2 family glycosyltransferase/peptidoglycan/xylan/chitin deacetylase (PgdA/CDA1 family)
MKWSIVIPTWQRADMLREHLRALETQSSRDFEVVIVCDGEDAATRALGESSQANFPTRWIFHRENLGLAAARNTGAATAAGEFILFLDDDVAPDANLLAEHDAAHAPGGEWPPSVVCGRIVEERQAPFRSKTDEFMQEAWERSLEEALPTDGSPNHSNVGGEAERTAWFGLNCSIRKNLFERLGGFDPLMRSDEEMEFGQRLYRSGILTRYAPKAVVRHRGSKDMSAYYPRCWRLSGRLDVHRAVERDERSAQISQLGDAARAGIAGIASKNPELLLALASAAEQITNLTGSRAAFAAWARLRHLGEYWSGVRETGVSRERLAQLAGPDRPILMYHSISAPQNAREATYYISPSRFRRQLGWLQLRGYNHVAPSDWLEEKPANRNVLLTFDDAYDDLHRELLSAVEEFNIKPLVFVVAGRIGGTNDWDARQGLRQRSLLSLDQMREMQRFGVQFGSHSLTHPLLTKLSTAELLREVRDSKSRLEDALGAPVEWFAYPYGDVDRRVRAAVLEAAYKASVTTDAGMNRWQDPLALQRLEIDERDWLIDFALKLSTGRNFRRSAMMRLGSFSDA